MRNNLLRLMQSIKHDCRETHLPPTFRIIAASLKTIVRPRFCPLDILWNKSPTAREENTIAENTCRSTRMKGVQQSPK